jgi:hypothetical protein
LSLVLIMINDVELFLDASFLFWRQICDSKIQPLTFVLSKWCNNTWITSIWYKSGW